MKSLRILTAAEQLAAYLREGIIRRTWVDTMPGTSKLAGELGIGMRTVSDALAKLEQEGLLVNQGKRKKRQIVCPDAFRPPALRIKILHYSPSDLMLHYLVDVRHQLLEAGHAVSFASKSLIEIGDDLGRVSEYIKNTEADAWVVVSGQRDMLEWCSQQEIPIFALAGRRRGIQIAGTGPDKQPALKDAVKHLVDLGHRRIVMLARKVRRFPKPGRFEQAFLDQLAEYNIPVSQAYNLPDWEDNQNGFHKVIDSLFSLTPPTALIIGELQLFYAAHLHLSQRGIVVPKDISLICDDPHPAFEWCQPSVAHISWQSNRWPKRVIQWANHVACGQNDLRQTFTESVFVKGGTVGPPLRK